MISIIAAIGKNRELGKSGTLPWHIPEELKFFKETTTGHPIIMGRKTYESIGRALPNRTNIIITRKSSYQAAEGCIVVASLDDAIEEAKKHEGSEEIFVIGGGQIYKNAIYIADKLYLTKVDASFDADVYFPEFSEFLNIISEKSMKTDDYSFTILELARQ